MALAAHAAGRPRFVFYRGVETGELFVYRNAAAAPRAFWAREVLGARTPGEESFLMQTIDARRAAVVLDETGGTPRKLVLGDPGEDRVALKERRAGSLALDLGASRRRFLVVSEVWHPGWRATLDGAPLPLLRADLALTGAWIPAGGHRMVMAFRPPLRRAGLLVSGASLLVLFLLAGIALHGRRLSVPGKSLGSFR
jgi:hypothetical protein